VWGYKLEAFEWILATRSKVPTHTTTAFRALRWVQIARSKCQVGSVRSVRLVQMNEAVHPRPTPSDNRSSQHFHSNSGGDPVSLYPSTFLFVIGTRHWREWSLKYSSLLVCHDNHEKPLGDARRLITQSDVGLMGLTPLCEPVWSFVRHLT
jgi:hypothetical protein